MSGLRLTMVLSVAGITGVSAEASVVLWANGPPDGSNGYGNETFGVNGLRRSVLDDFVVPEGETWEITGFQWQHIWNTLPPGSGTGLDLSLLTNTDRDEPGDIFHTVDITSYNERGTGQTWFNRPGAESWVTFEPVALGPGTYWFDAVIHGPESNFWLVHTEVRGSECWVDYTNQGDRESGSNHFGVEADLNFVFTGEVIPAPGIGGLLALAGLARTRRRR